MKNLKILFAFVVLLFSSLIFGQGKVAWRVKTDLRVKQIIPLENGEFLVFSLKKASLYNKDGKKIKTFNLPEECQGKFFKAGNDKFAFASVKNNFFVIDKNGNKVLKKYFKNLLLLGNNKENNLFFAGIEGRLKPAYGGTIVADQKLAAIDTNGNIKWKYFTKNESLSFAKEINGDIVLLGAVKEGSNGDADVFAISQDKGNLIKTLKIKTGKTPIIIKNLVLFLHSNTKDYSFYLTAYSIPSLEAKWSTKTGTTKVFPSLFGDRIIFTLPGDGMIPEYGTLKAYSLDGKLLATLGNFPYISDYGFDFKDYFIFPKFDNLYAMNKWYETTRLPYPEGYGNYFFKSGNRLFIANPNLKILKAIDF